MLAFATRPFSAETVNVVITIDVNASALFASELSDPRVAPVIIRAAAVDVYVPVVANVGDVDCIDEDRCVATSVVDAVAAPVRIRPEIADIDERVIVGSDVAGGIHPRADAHVDVTTRFRWQRCPSDTITTGRVVPTLTPRYPRWRPHGAGHPRPAASDTDFRPTSVVITGPCPRLVRNECPAAVFALFPTAVGVRRPASRDASGLPAGAPFGQLHPPAIGVERFALIKIVALDSDLIVLLLDEPGRQTFIPFSSGFSRGDFFAAGGSTAFVGVLRQD